MDSLLNSATLWTSCQLYAPGGSRTMEPAPSDQMRATGSGRRKVALPPGRSQLDWMRNSAKHKPARLQNITLSQLATHKGHEDAWLALDGVVYDVSHYLEYHPGGVNILAAASGKDATELFNKYHPWVNAQGMLSNYVVGRLIPDPKK